MLIYQIHEYGGSYEDSYDWIHSTYLDKDQAEEEKIKLEAFEEQRYKEVLRCQNCPGYEKCPDYAPDSDGLPYCENNELDFAHYYYEVVAEVVTE